ncbi:hypothetical protein CLF_110260 [Clonorchis sinensis]|uniref:Dynein axonemal assembly factor 5 TPR repeats domain-containing protein n=1 Tax=Clonorchis sinensis TaxID=79923 RepID=G7YTB9_CLOSI|nr:hypothetical protein CLF_110260 [Clonorchis sinensis]
MCSLEHHRVSGPDALPPALFKDGGQILSGRLSDIFARIWEKGTVPGNWAEIWRTRDLRAPSYLWPAGIDFLAPIMDKDLDDIQWSSGGIGEVHGGLTVACFLLKNLSDDQLRALHILHELENRVLECHENVEFRVRIAAGHLMGLLCFRCGLVTFKRFLPSVIEGITTNLERSPDAPATESESSLRELIIAKERDVNMSRSSLSVFHDTAGWKNLETWMKCLQEMVVSLKPEDFVQIDRSQILDLVFKATNHVNRFVRETGYEVLATVIHGHGCYKNPAETEANYLKVAQQILKGLSDNWCQVRMTASRAVRTFFEVPPPPEHSATDVYPILLPAMCLNRYYVAEGVRLYSQETWCRVTKGEGKKLIGIYLDAVVDYYTQQATADNPTVREVSCTSISEIVSKLSPDLMRSHILKVLTALLICFDDTSWSARDAACAALGTLVSKFPEETKAAGYKNLLADQFLRNLSDSIPSVRDTAAYSIANILKSISDPELIQGASVDYSPRAQLVDFSWSSWACDCCGNLVGGGACSAIAESFNNARYLSAFLGGLFMLPDSGVKSPGRLSYIDLNAFATLDFVDTVPSSVCREAILQLHQCRAQSVSPLETYSYVGRV